MLNYIKFDGDIPIKAIYSGMPPFEEHDKWRSNWDWTSFEQVERIARLLTITTGKPYLAVDQGERLRPKFCIMEPYKVGQPVSYAFNGDFYPNGYIAKITPSLQIITDTGSRYVRVKKSSTWRKTGGTWVLVPGHIYSLNPSF